MAADFCVLPLTSYLLLLSAYRLPLTDEIEQVIPLTSHLFTTGVVAALALAAATLAAAALALAAAALIFASAALAVASAARTAVASAARTAVAHAATA